MHDTNIWPVVQLSRFSESLYDQPLEKTLPLTLPNYIHYFSTVGDIPKRNALCAWVTLLGAEFLTSQNGELQVVEAVDLPGTALIEVATRQTQ